MATTPDTTGSFVPSPARSVAFHPRPRQSRAPWWMKPPITSCIAARSTIPRASGARWRPRSWCGRNSGRGCSTGSRRDARWFVGGTLNVSENCLDRHLATRGDKAALLWEGEPGDERRADLPRAARARSAGSPTCCTALGVDTGRSRRHLHADDPRGGGRDAGLHPHRRAAHRRVRRLLGRGAARSHQRLRRQGVHHRRRRLAARQGGAAQGERRRRAGRRRRRSSTCVVVKRTGDGGRHGRRAATTGGTS